MTLTLTLTPTITRIRLAKSGGHDLPDMRKVKRAKPDGAYVDKHPKTDGGAASGGRTFTRGDAAGAASSSASCEADEADGDAKGSDALSQLASLAVANLGSPTRGLGSPTRDDNRIEL